MSLARLLVLPTEIRALIFEYVVKEPQLVTFRLEAFQRDCYQYATQPALSRVNRQIRCESLPIYYEVNDFVLHTEGSKAADGRKWLLCNAAHLSSLKRMTFWVRYVPLANNERAPSRGAIGVSIYRHRKHQDWLVDPKWTWITVVRKPAELDRDAKVLVGRLQDMTNSLSVDRAGIDELTGLLNGLNLYYLPVSSSF